MRVERSALVVFSAQQMFDLINDIETYPQFMEGCIAAEILSRNDGEVQARLTLRKAGIEHSFVTRNRLSPPTSMSMSLVEGPFRHLEGQWLFQPLAADACKVSFELEFELASRLLGVAVNPWFEGVANQMVDALCRRAEAVYSVR